MNGDPPDPTSDGPASGRALRTTLALGAAALAVRLAYLVELDGTPFEDVRGMIRDCEYYDARARAIAGGDWIGDTPGFLSPLYCLFVGAVYALAGPSLLAVKLVQAALGALSVALVHRTGRRVFASDAAGVAAALLLVPYGLLPYYEALLLPTTLVLFLHVVLLWLATGGPLAGGRALACGVVAGLAVGAKANALLLVPVLAGFALAARGRTPARRLAAAGLVVLGAALAVAPITARNLAASGELVLVTTTGGRNLAKGNGPTANGTHVLLDERGVSIVDHLRGDVDVQRAVREDRELRAETLAAMRADPARTLGLFGRKLELFFNGMELGIRDNFPFARERSLVLRAAFVSFWMLAPLGLAGLALLVGERRETLLLGAVLATQVVSFVLIFVLARYRVVAVAVLALFAGGLAARVAADLRAGRPRRPLLALAVLLLAGYVALRPVQGFEQANPAGELHLRAGEWYLERGRFDEARERFEAAARLPWPIESDAGHLVARARVADCLEATGEPEAARRLREALLRDVMRRYPVRPLELKTELRRALGRTGGG